MVRKLVVVVGNKQGEERLDAGELLENLEKEDGLALGRGLGHRDQAGGDCEEDDDVEQKLGGWLGEGLKELLQRNKVEKMGKKMI